MEIDLGTGKIRVKLAGKKFEIRDPNYADIESLQKDEDKEKAIYNFLSRLGAPEEVTKEIGILTLRRFTDQLMSPFQAKK